MEKYKKFIKIENSSLLIYSDTKESSMVTADLVSNKIKHIYKELYNLTHDAEKMLHLMN